MKPQRVQLTLLQRGVIQRLREAGFPALAELARDHWSVGERIPRDSRAWPHAVKYRELLQDFDRADAQAESETR